MCVKLLAEHHWQFLSLKGGCTGSSESTLIKIPHCWIPHVAAQCISVDCGDPPGTSNGFVSTDGGTTEGHIATYDCKDGYEVSHPSIRVCQKSSGTWSGTIPSCEPICK